MADKNIDSNSDKEIRYMLKDPLGRSFFMRLLYEDLRVFDSGFQCNATAYTLLAKKEIGCRLLDQAKRVDFSKVQLAEQEYLDSLKQEENNG